MLTHDLGVGVGVRLLLSSSTVTMQTDGVQLLACIYTTRMQINRQGQGPYDSACAAEMAGKVRIPATLRVQHNQLNVHL
jgi:hypothetical protein